MELGSLNRKNRERKKYFQNTWRNTVKRPVSYGQLENPDWLVPLTAEIVVSY